MENTGLSILGNLVSLVDTIASIVTEVTNENTVEEARGYTQEELPTKNINEEKTIINNNKIVINGGIHIGTININTNGNNSGAYPKSSSQSNDYWVEQDKKYRESLGRFYRSNF